MSGGNHMELTDLIVPMFGLITAAIGGEKAYKFINKNKSQNGINQKGKNNNAIMNSSININQDNKHSKGE